MRSPFRLAVLLDSLQVRAWQLEALRQLRAAEYVQIVLVVLGPAQVQASGSHSGKGDNAELKPFLYRIFERWQGSKAPAPDACEIVCAAEAIERIDLVQLPGQSTDEAASRQLAEALGKVELDVVLVLGGRARKQEIASSATYGAWYYSHSYLDDSCAAGTEVGFWEVLKRRPYIQSSLSRCSPGMPDTRLLQSFSPVNPLSFFHSRNSHLWKIQAFAARALRLLHEGRTFSESAGGEAGDKVPRFLPLTGKRLLPAISRYVLWRLWQKVVRRFYTRRWILMYTRQAPSEVSGYHKIIPPSGRFWADPHLVRREGKDYIFFEDASLSSWRGHLSVMTVNDEGKCSEATRIIEKPYHLSYPFVLEWQGEVWLIPESGENRTIEAYRCLDFPFRWEFSHYLMKDIDAYDATLFEHEGIWWMFANVKEHPSASSWDELCLFFSDNPLSNTWQPHPLNPIVSDVRQARPAGPLFRRDGRIIRPSQNSSYRYGYGLNFCEVIELSKTAYREKVIRSVRPDWDPDVQGLHSYCANESLAVIDAIYRSRRRKSQRSQ